MLYNINDKISSEFSKSKDKIFSKKVFYGIKYILVLYIFKNLEGKIK